MPDRENIVVALITRDDKVLLVKEAYGLRLWELPGGNVGDGEDLVQATVRDRSYRMV